MTETRVVALVDLERIKFGMVDNLLPRHQLIVNFLTEKAPKRFTAGEIAKATKLSIHTVANEMPVVMRFNDTIQRGIVRHNKGYRYYVGKPEGQISYQKPPAEPYSYRDFARVAQIVVQPDYQPALSLDKLGWKLPVAMTLVLNAASTQDYSKLGRARQLIEELSSSVDTLSTVIERLLATPELWSTQLHSYLVGPQSEENLEIMLQLTRQALAHWGKLEASKQTDPNY
jgi:hypothetical protein